MIEKERKFELKASIKDWDTLLNWTQHIQQAYLILEDDKHLRVRLIYDIRTETEKAYLTYKVVHSNEIRTEYEYEIPVKDAREMFDSTDVKLTKVRTKLEHNGNKVDVDLYLHSFYGGAVVEIEYENELKPEDIPDYCGTEITYDEERSNIWIALKNAENKDPRWDFE